MVIVMRKWQLTKWLYALFEPRDLWVGAFLDTVKRRLYLLPVPTLGIVIEFPGRDVIVPWLYKWGPVQVIYGVGQTQPYFTRVKLMPWTPWGQLYLHIFHAAEPNEDPHDHAYDYGTMALGQGYVEEVFLPTDGDRRPGGLPISGNLHKVPAWTWTKRKAEHTHRITGVDKGFPLLTLFWQGPTRRQWGFWTSNGWVYWKEYMFK